MNNLQLSDKLKNFEDGYVHAANTNPVGKSDLLIRYNKLQVLAASAGTLIKSLTERNEDLLKENAELKGLLFRAMEKNLIGDVDL